MAVSIKGTPNTSTTPLVTLPTHAVGDLIVIWAVGASSVPTKPSASGTVPAWNTPDAGVTQGALGMIWAYFVATATNHTSGTWTGAGGMVAVVINGQASSPIGGHAIAGAANSSTTATAPSITMTNTSGTSLLLEFFGTRITSSIGSPSSGYTQQASNFSTSGVGVVLDTKNTTTSDGSVTHAMSQSISNNNGGATIEILVGGTAWTADCSLSGTASLSSAVQFGASGNASLAGTASPTADIHRSVFGDSALAVTDSPTAVINWSTFIASSTAATAGISSAVSLSALLDSLTSATASPSGSVTRIFEIDSSTSVTAGFSADQSRVAGAEALMPITASPTSAVNMAALMDVNKIVGAIPNVVLNMDTTIDASLGASALTDVHAPTSENADASLAIIVTPTADIHRDVFADASLGVSGSPLTSIMEGRFLDSSLNVSASGSAALSKQLGMTANLIISVTPTAGGTLSQPELITGWWYLPE